MIQRVILCLCILCVLPVVTGAPAAAADFGFTGTEFHKLGWGTHNMRVADINGDGRKDVVVVNNGKARIECMIQRKDPNAAPRERDLEPNEIPDSRLFENRPYLSEKRVFCMELGDLNGDGRTDMAYYGHPLELVVVYQNAKGEWGKRRTFDITDGARRQHCLAIGDLNNDKRNDLILLGSDGTYIVYQDAKGNLKAPVKESGVPSEIAGIIVRDFNGDGRTDILYMSFAEPEPVCIRFQDAEGRLGPEIRSQADPLRAVGFGDPDGDGTAGVVAIKQKSGRVVAFDLGFEKSAALPGGNGSMLAGSMERYTLRNSGSQVTPGLAVGRFYDKTRLDFAVTASKANVIEIFRRTTSGHWADRMAFPTLQGVTRLVAIDADGDGKDELVVLSAKESTLGYAKVDARGRLTFPKSLPIVGKPSAVTVGDLDGCGKPHIIYTGSKGLARSLHVLTYRDGAFVETATLELKRTRSDPSDLLMADINQDGRPDVLAFIPYEGLRVLKNTGEGKLEDVSQKPGFGRGLVREARLKQVAVADVDGDGKAELLVADKNFVRALRLDKSDSLTVVDQFNGRLASSAIAGVAAADLDGDKTPELIFVDTGTRCLSALKRNKMGVYEIVENLRTPPLALERIIVGDLTGDKRPEIMLLTKAGCRILRPGRPRLVLKEKASYETPQRNGHLLDVTLGDLDRDGRDELVITEGTKHGMEIVQWRPEKKDLRRVLNWAIYESKTFGRGRYGKGRTIEPRQFLMDDVTGDGKPDILMLIHDRVLVYPQE